MPAVVAIVIVAIVIVAIAIVVIVLRATAVIVVAVAVAAAIVSRVAILDAVLLHPSPTELLCHSTMRSMRSSLATWAILVPAAKRGATLATVAAATVAPTETAHAVVIADG